MIEYGILMCTTNHSFHRTYAKSRAGRLIQTLESMIGSLRNLGPKSEVMLRQAGINTIEELRSLGAVKAYALVKRSGVNASLNLLWALEGALCGRPWQEVAKSDKLSLLLQLEQVQSYQTGTIAQEDLTHPSSGRAKAPSPYVKRWASR